VGPEFACLGVAGIVAEKKARITNLPWLLDEEVLAARFSLSGVRLINDMTALSASLSSLGADDLLQIQDAARDKDGTKAVIAPGTGLGEGYLIETETLFLPRGSEGGHSDFAPVNDEQLELLQWLGRRSWPVSYEMLCSGLGIPTLYDFCREQSFFAETKMIREQLDGVRDRTPVIVNGAISREPCPLCQKTVELFLSILGSEAGNLALKLYALGGLYIGGGIMPRLVGKFPFTSFLEAFGRKEKMEHLMARIPINLIRRPDAVLCGAAVFGRRYFHLFSG
jgi:glucokinase